MNKGRAVPALINPLKVDNEGRWVVLREGHYLSAKEGNNMVRDDLARFILEVGIIDTEVRVEPIDFPSNKFMRNETLRNRSILITRDDGR